jgi:hypothetical protein
MQDLADELIEIWSLSSPASRRSKTRLGGWRPFRLQQPGGIRFVIPRAFRAILALAQVAIMVLLATRTEPCSTWNVGLRASLPRRGFRVCAKRRHLQHCPGRPCHRRPCRHRGRPCHRPRRPYHRGRPCPEHAVWRPPILSEPPGGFAGARPRRPWVTAASSNDAWRTLRHTAAPTRRSRACFHKP